MTLEFARKCEEGKRPVQLARWQMAEARRLREIW